MMFLYDQDFSEEKKYLLYEHLEKNGVLILSDPIWKPSEKEENALRSSIPEHYKNKMKVPFRSFPSSLKLLLLKHSAKIQSSLATLFPSRAYDCKSLDSTIIYVPKERPFQLEKIKRSHGNRILSIYTILSCKQDSEWSFSSDFLTLANRYLKKQSISFHVPGAIMEKQFHKFINFLRVPIRMRSFYDILMKQIAKQVPKDQNLQEQIKHEKGLQGRSYLFFSDGIVHALPSSSLLLHQRYLVSRTLLVNPEYSPVSILERMTGQIMVSPTICDFKP